MSTCGTPPSTNGGTVITSGPYSAGYSAVYQCLSGYYMTGDSYLTCDGTNWIGTTPTCSAQDTNQVDLTLNDSTSSGLESWLLYVIATVCVLLGLLVCVCIIALCFHFCGCYGKNSPLGEPKIICPCCRKTTTHSYELNENLCKTFPRRYFYDLKGRRFHIDDVGRRCYKDHHNRHVATTEYDENSTRGTVVTVSEIGMEKSPKPVAKEVVAWKPHAHGVRNINTSTK